MWGQCSTRQCRVERGGFASHRHDSCVNLNVDVQWWTGDRLYKNYANRPGTGKDFRMRGMPAMGSTTNAKKHDSEAPAFYPKPGVGVDGSSVTDVGSMGFELYEKTVDDNTPERYVSKQKMPDGVTVAPNTRSPGLTKTFPQGVDSNEKVEQLVHEMAKAQTTFPDPWDLPAAVPMLVDTSSQRSTYDNLPRNAYHSVGRQRGVFRDEDSKTRKGRKDAVLKGGVVMDPGNKFELAKIYEGMLGTEFDDESRMNEWYNIVANEPN